MFLSRVMENLKREHWTAIFLDFVIVVLGVFIGTNVTNWNDARKLHERSQSYTQQLRDDMRVEYVHTHSLLAYDADTLQAGQAAFEGLTKRRPMDDRAILVNAYRASQFQWYERHDAAYNELLSAGQLDLVSDPTLRNTAVRYYGNTTTAIELILQDRRDSEYRRLFSRLVDPDVQLALVRDCGDRPYTSPDGVSGLLTIHYSCKLDVDDATVSKAVNTLRSDPGVLPALRRQINVYNVESNSLAYLIDETGMRSLFGTGKGQ